jgi:hypothetical protein
MAFAAFLVYLVLTFLRPGEQVAALREWPVMDVASALALGTATLAVIGGRAPAFRSAQVPLVLLLWCWTLLTVIASPQRSMAALDPALGFGKSSCVAFLLAALNVSSLRRFRLVVVTLSLVGLIVAVQAAIQWGVQPMASRSSSEGERSGLVEAPALTKGGDNSPAPTPDLFRYRGVGMFADPNDFAVTLLAVVPLCFTLRRVGAFIYNAVIVWAPLSLITYGVYLTRSRTGAVTLAAILVLALRQRVGTPVALGAAWLVLSSIVAMGFLGGRALEMDQSVMGRIYAWSDGLQMLKSSPVWGVGFGMFTFHHPRAAHNSYVHCVAELGFAGYLLWWGLILLTLDDLRLIAGADSHGAAGLRRWANALFISIVGLMVGGVFLSRAYDLMLFVQLGLGTGLAQCARLDGQLSRSRSVVWSATVTVAFAVASIIAVWIYMRMQ